MEDLGGRVAVVTGGASGIGLALARQLAAAGDVAAAAVDAIREDRFWVVPDADIGQRLRTHLAPVLEAGAVAATNRRGAPA